MSNLQDVTLAFIGSGVMAEAMINGILGQGLTDPPRMIASDPLTERGQELAERHGVKATADNRQAAKAAQIVVLSVKPQVLPVVLKELKGVIDPSGLVLSIVAGARIKVIAEGLGHSAVVRVMPNTPAQVGQGMSVWTATAEVSDGQRAQAQSILRALGEEIYLEDEDYLDMATALSGTGPAYAFLFMEALIDAGVHLGFSRRVAQQLVLQTLQGSVAFARQSIAHPAELRNMVTSPGGTSAEALYQLEKGGFRTVLSRAIWAAYQKSKYLGELSSK
ncbi:MAG: pyrroline-5-carboxylate reductase [Anaerolineae bacterium]